MNSLRVAPHLIQCGDRTGTIIKNCEKLKKQFCVPEEKEIREKRLNDFQWLQIWTTLPIYTTSTLGDQMFLITNEGDIVFS